MTEQKKERFWGPAGFNSMVFHQCILLIWAHWTKSDIGEKGARGDSLYVSHLPTLGFCVETRGPGMGSLPRLHFPFDPTDRESRRKAFTEAKEALAERVTYTGRVRAAAAGIAKRDYSPRSSFANH